MNEESESEEMKKRLETTRKYALRTLHIILFFDMFAVSLVIPLLPYYAQKVGMDKVTYGLLGTAFGTTQLIGGPIIGRLADQYGRVKLFYFAIIASSLSYLMVGLATSSAMLIGSRILIGLLKQTTTIASSYVSDITTHEARTEELAYTRFIMSVAFIIGPSLGGFLSGFGLHVPAITASFIFLVELFIVFTFLPSSEKMKLKLEDSKKEMENIDDKENMLPIETVNPVSDGIFTNKKLMWLLLLYFTSNIASLGFLESFSLFVRDTLVLSTTVNGYVWTYLSLLSSLTQRYGVKIFNDFLGEHYSLLCGGFLLGGALMVFSSTKEILLIMVILIPIQLCRGLLETNVISLATKTTNRQGTALGIMDSICAGIRASVPTVIGILLRTGGISYPMILCASSATVFSLLVSFFN